MNNNILVGQRYGLVSKGNTYNNSIILEIINPKTKECKVIFNDNKLNKYGIGFQDCWTSVEKSTHWKLLPNQNK